MTDPKYIAERTIELAKHIQDYSLTDSYEAAYDAGYSRANSELEVTKYKLELSTAGKCADTLELKAQNDNLRAALDVVVEAMHAALNESSRAKQNGCAITNVGLKEYLEPALAKIKTLIGESGGK
ncbi:MAG: hypothetical protein ACK58T_18375 [Phycisphaerae bacterium]|jgi:hypothetical protein